MYIVSGCLLGYDCKYNGGNNRNEDVVKFVDGTSYLVVCPEQAGGLESPRPPAEQVLQDDGTIKLINSEGLDLTKEFKVGASKTLTEVMERAFLHGEKIEGAILKANSPSCGVGQVYDGTFSGKLVKGDGVFAAMLIDMGVPVYTEKNFKENLK